ncbi:MAG: FHA domain-containing protein, partial [Cyanobacteria bacterium J06576_12]
MLKTKVINTQTNDVYEAQLTPRSLSQAECLIGRHPNCDLVLDGPAVSRVHGRLLFEADACFFVDLGSTDGSRLNNEEVGVNQVYAIAPDDILRIGEFAVIIEALNPQSVQPVSNAWNGGTITARCVQINAETHDVKTFRFVAEPSILFDFKPGQFVTLTLPITHPQTGRSVTRSYSISSSPSRPHTLDITVKRVGPANDDLPPGLVSNWLHDHLEVGMTLPMQGPYGDFNCVDHPAQKLLLISAGSGITPMMSMSQWLSDRATDTDITFIHTARTAQDIIFRQRLAL